MSNLALAVTALFASMTSNPTPPAIVQSPKTYMEEPVHIKTETRFSVKEITETKDIPFETETKEDPDSEVGNVKTVQEGKNGIKKLTYKIEYYDGEEINRTLLKTETTPAVNKIIQSGTKIVWHQSSAGRCGSFKYWKRYEGVYMTTYTNQCEGCNAWTSLGLKAGYGIIAVDPRKIPYWTKVCIPEYGIAIAGDTGGAMRSYPGLLIDLGFNSMSPADKWMSTGRYDMYILNNEDRVTDFFGIGQ